MDPTSTHVYTVTEGPYFFAPYTMLLGVTPNLESVIIAISDAAVDALVKHRFVCNFSQSKIMKSCNEISNMFAINVPSKI